MKRFFLLPILFLSIFSANAQVNWADDVAEIIYGKCVNCHRPNGIGPYEFTSYQSAYDFRYLIQDAVATKSMPPWLPDPNYSHFADEFYLTQAEQNLIMDWVNSGAPSGDLSQEPPLPPIPSGASELESIDFQLSFESAYTLQSNNDEYRWFVVENPFDTPIYIEKIEVFPGLKDVVHHADLYYDSDNSAMANELADPLPGFNSATGGNSSERYLNAWQPGANLMEYPEGWAQMILPGGSFVMELHYGPGGQGEPDSTVMNLQLLPVQDVVREVDSGWLLYDSAPVLLDGPLFIPANEVKTFHQRTQPFQEDLSLINICPHMHYLGKSYKVWAELPDGEIIPLIDIPDWDFNWQRYYTFPYILHLPAGSTLNSVGVYDNTANNPYNPSNPPVDVSRGERTQDEMFLTYFTFAPYHEGDENIFMGDTIPDEFGVPVFETGENALSLEIFPNPVQEKLFVNSDIQGEVSLEIRDVSGKLIRQNNVDITSLKTNGISLDEIPSAMYFIEISQGGNSTTKSFVKE